MADELRSNETYSDLIELKYVGLRVLTNDFPMKRKQTWREFKSIEYKKKVE